MEVEIYSSSQAEGLCVDALRRAIGEMEAALFYGERAGFGTVWQLSLQQAHADAIQSLREAEGKA